eukprot:scaffold569_cov408-Prasinococcus_capsulatus_cf.AAC.25
MSWSRNKAEGFPCPVAGTPGTTVRSKSSAKQLVKKPGSSSLQEKRSDPPESDYTDTESPLGASFPGTSSSDARTREHDSRQGCHKGRRQGDSLKGGQTVRRSFQGACTSLYSRYLGQERQEPVLTSFQNEALTTFGMLAYCLALFMVVRGSSGDRGRLGDWALLDACVLVGLNRM